MTDFLNGDYWLVTARFPVACDAIIREVTQSEPTDADIDELVDDCIDSYGYLRPIDDELAETEEERYEIWYDELREDIEVNAYKIDEKIIDEYGTEYLEDHLV